MLPFNGWSRAIYTEYTAARLDGAASVSLLLVIMTRRVVIFVAVKLLWQSHILIA